MASASTDRMALAGGISGIVEGLVVQPLDMIKTRFQLMAAPGVSRPTIGSALHGLIREGGLPRLYRGVVPELAAMTPKASAMYLSYEEAKRVLRARGGLDGTPLHLAAGLASGVPEAIVVTPFQVVKVRLQAKEHLGRYRSTWHCLGRVVVEEGVLALTTGFTATVCRNSVWNAVYFAALHGAREARVLGGEPAGGSSGGALETLRTAALGFGAGIFATCFNAPFDVAKSRIQSARAAAGASDASAPSLVVRLAAIFRDEGLSGLYAGFTPKALRMGVGGAVGIAAYEAAIRVLSQWP